MHDALRFWLDRGVDGFRVDVIWHLIKDAEFRDNPPNPAYRARPSRTSTAAPGPLGRPARRCTRSSPGCAAVLDEYSDRVLIGEIYLPLERLVAYYGKDLSGAHLPFNFQLIHTPGTPARSRCWCANTKRRLPEGGWPNWVLGNHDQPRIAARVGDAASARRGDAAADAARHADPVLRRRDRHAATSTIPPDRVQDPWEKNEPGLGLGRDPERTPMQWDGVAERGLHRAASPGCRSPRTMRRAMSKR